MASVEQRGESWRVVWRPGGRETRRRYATLPTADMAESARRLVDIRLGRITAEEVYAAVWGARKGDDSPPTVAEWAGTWIEQRRAVGEVQPDTITEQHRILMRRILPYLGQLPVNAVTLETVQGWVAWLVAQPTRAGGRLDADTVRHAHSVLHGLPPGLPGGVAAGGDRGLSDRWVVDGSCSSPGAPSSAARSGGRSPKLCRRDNLSLVGPPRNHGQDR